MPANTNPRLSTERTWTTESKYSATVLTDLIITNVGDGPVYMAYRIDDTLPADTIEGVLLKEGDSVYPQVSAGQRIFFRGLGSVEITEEEA